MLDYWIAGWAVDYITSGAAGSLAEKLASSLCSWLAGIFEWLFDPQMLMGHADALLTNFFVMIHDRIPSVGSWTLDFADFFASTPLTNLWEVALYFVDMFVPASLVTWVVGAKIAQYVLTLTVRVIMWILSLIWSSPA